MEFRILGPLQVVQDGESFAVGPVQQRALLAVLVLHRGEVVSTDRLIDELWGERPPATAAKTVQVYISHLRKVLGAGVIVTEGRGYRLAVEPEQVDVGRFDALSTEGRRALAAGDAARARERLCSALGLWRGEPLAEFAYEPFAQSAIAQLQKARLAVFEDRIEAELALGSDGELIGGARVADRLEPAAGAVAWAVDARALPCWAPGGCAVGLSGDERAAARGAWARARPGAAGARALDPGARPLAGRRPVGDHGRQR